MGLGGEYRINLYRDDGSLSLVVLLNAHADADAKGEAESMLKNGLVLADIWREEVRVGTVRYRAGRPSPVLGWRIVS